MKPKHLGVLAGEGELPAIAIKQALKEGFLVFVYVVAGEEDNYPGAKKVEKVRIEKFGSLLKLFQKDKLNTMFIVGKVTKKVFFKDLPFDLKSLSVLRKMVNKNDHEIFTVIAQEIESLGIEIFSQTRFLKSLLADEGVLSRKKPDKKQILDIEHGLSMASGLSELDIGQTVIVSNGVVWAVEAMEGTDETIERAGRLMKNRECVVCKSSRKNQDFRFDIPTVGVQTLETMKKNNAKVLAVEAGRTLIVSKKEFIHRADELGIIVTSRKLN